MAYWVYILASKPQGTLYIGVTNDLLRRIWEHREEMVPGFTKTYGVKRLVYWEQFDQILDAIARDKQLKRWRRDWKRALIEEFNPHWLDLFPEQVRAAGFQLPPSNK